MGCEVESIAMLAFVMPEHGRASQAGTSNSFRRRVVGCGIAVDNMPVRFGAGCTWHELPKRWPGAQETAKQSDDGQRICLAARQGPSTPLQ